MELKKIYIPFDGIFPALTGFLGGREDFQEHFPKINQETLYGQAHKGASVIDRRVNNLHLIMHRLRINSGVHLRPGDNQGIDFLYLPIDFESFFIWLRLIMDLIAYLTPLFYERQGIVTNKSFNDQKAWFIKNGKALDKNYSRYLEKNTEWFEDMRDVRDDSLHRHFWSYVELGTSGEIKLKRMRGNKLEEEIQSLAILVGDYYLKFVEFSRFYEKHFSGVLKSRDKNFKFLGQHVEMNADFFVSIDYFMQQKLKNSANKTV